MIQTRKRNESSTSFHFFPSLSTKIEFFHFSLNFTHRKDPTAHFMLFPALSCLLMSLTRFPSENIKTSNRNEQDKRENLSLHFFFPVNKNRIFSILPTGKVQLLIHVISCFIMSINVSNSIFKWKHQNQQQKWARQETWFTWIFRLFSSKIASSRLAQFCPH